RPQRGLPGRLRGGVWPTGRGWSSPTTRAPPPWPPRGGRCGAGPAAEHFYAEHVEADAVHEQVVRHEVIGGLLADEPALEEDVAFGCAATVMLEERLACHIRQAWDHGHSALRAPLPER
ncbi:iron-containing redox enzyme family protein, partial [Streptomyces lavendulae]|uniref:iron-containing redox enzyme family protein n=1 Tax=Streptomyces lavendulae TaxID=1914 RepID=UPI0036894718